MAAALDPVGTISISRRCIRAPGLLGCIAVTAGMPSSAADLAAGQTVAPGLEGRPGHQHVRAEGAQRLAHRAPGPLALVVDEVVAAHEDRDHAGLVAQSRLKSPGSTDDLVAHRHRRTGR